MTAPLWSAPPPLPDEPPPPGAEILWRLERAGDLWTATPIGLRSDPASGASESWLLAWAREPGAETWEWCLLAWLDFWEHPGHDGQIRGSNPRSWRTGWARFDPALVEAWDWPRARRGGWTRYAAERLSMVIEHVRDGEIGWIDAG